MKKEIGKLIEDHCEMASVMAKSLAKQKRIFGDDRQELISAAFVGLCEAAHRYDPERGASFKTFASIRIKGAMLDQARTRNGLSRGHYKQLGQENPGTQFLGYEPTSAKGLVSKICAEDALHFDAVGIDDSYYVDLVYRSSLSDPEFRLIKKNTTDYIRNLVARLKSDERKVIEGRYFENRKIDSMPEELSELSKSTISRLHTRALDSLRQLIASEALKCSRMREET